MNIKTDLLHIQLILQNQVTIWEIFSLGDTPFPGLSWNLEFCEELVSGLRNKKPPLASDAV